MTTSYFAGGCFWCITPAFRIRGVDRVASGYSGGQEEDPSYEDVKAGNLAKILAAKPLQMPGVTDTLPAFKIPELTAKANDDGTVEISDGEDDETFALVNGKWIPKDLSEGFEESMKEAKANLADFEIPAEMKPQLAMMFPMVSNAAKKAAKAETKEDFQQSLMQGLMPVMISQGSQRGTGQQKESQLYH